MDAPLYDPQLIDPLLWAQAGWRGVGYVFDRLGEEPPRIGPIFRDPEAGTRIFEHWQRSIGREDRYEVLRFVLVTGLKEGHAVVLSTAPEAVAAWAEARGARDVGYVLTQSQVCVLPGPPNAFLQTLRARAEAALPYLLTPFAAQERSPVPTGLDLSILKHRFEVRAAAEIAPDEPDGVVFQEGSGA